MLARLWEEGYTGSQIAAQFGNITRNAVIGKVHREGIGPRRGLKQAKRLQPAPKPELKIQPIPLPKTKPTRPGTIMSTEPPLKTPNGLKTIHGLEPGDCRWPVGDPREMAEFGFYGKPVEFMQVYCGEHCRQAYPNHTPIIESKRAA